MLLGLATRFWLLPLGRLLLCGSSARLALQLLPHLHEGLTLVSSFALWLCSGRSLGAILTPPPPEKLLKSDHLWLGRSLRLWLRGAETITEEGSQLVIIATGSTGSLLQKLLEAELLGRCLRLPSLASRASLACRACRACLSGPLLLAQDLLQQLLLSRLATRTGRRKGSLVIRAARLPAPPELPPEHRLEGFLLLLLARLVLAELLPSLSRRATATLRLLPKQKAHQVLFVIGGFCNRIRHLRVSATTRSRRTAASAALPRLAEELFETHRLPLLPPRLSRRARRSVGRLLLASVKEIHQVVLFAFCTLSGFRGRAALARAGGAVGRRTPLSHSRILRRAAADGHASVGLVEIGARYLCTAKHVAVFGWDHAALLGASIALECPLGASSTEKAPFAAFAHPREGRTGRLLLARSAASIGPGRLSKVEELGTLLGLGRADELGDRVVAGLGVPAQLLR